MDSMLFPAYLVLDMPSFPGSTVLTDTKATKIRDLRGTNQMSKTTLKSIYSGFSSCSHLFSCSAFLLLPSFTCPCVSGVKSIFAEEQCFPMYMITKKNFGTFHIGVKHAFLPSWKQIVKQQCHHNHNRIATEINLLKIFRFKELPIISSEFRTRPRWQYIFF